MKLVVFSVFIPGVAGHAMLVEPPARTTQGQTIGLPNCAGGSCMWFNEGTYIGCPKVNGEGGPTGKANCDHPAKPTIKTNDTNFGTIFGDWNGTHSIGDWSATHPWRFPGAAPVEDPCGIMAGWFKSYEPGDQAGYGYPIGALGSKMPPLLSKTTWIAGSNVEVAWGITANHGGGYQYRLCRVSGRKIDITGEATEECFQKTPLEFVGNVQWVQFGHEEEGAYGDGMNPLNRVPINATRVAQGTKPEGSTWTRNPIPACNDVPGMGYHNHDCEGPMFKPTVDGVFGYGPGACNAGSLSASCNKERYIGNLMPFSVVDLVKVPDVPAGDYVLSFRYDSEQMPQIWTQCADVEIRAEGTAKPTKPFSPWLGCEVCCEQTLGMCSNCSSCLHDQTGACSYCWKPIPGFQFGGNPPLQCLGHEGPDGGPGHYRPGDEFPVTSLFSPGCRKCWSEPGRCEATYRETGEDGASLSGGYVAMSESAIKRSVDAMMPRYLENFKSVVLPGIRNESKFSVDDFQFATVNIESWTVDLIAGRGLRVNLFGMSYATKPTSIVANPEAGVSCKGHVIGKSQAASFTGVSTIFVNSSGGTEVVLPGVFNPGQVSVKHDMDTSDCDQFMDFFVDTAVLDVLANQISELLSDALQSTVAGPISRFLNGLENPAPFEFLNTTFELDNSFVSISYGNGMLVNYNKASIKSKDGPHKTSLRPPVLAVAPDRDCVASFSDFAFDTMLEGFFQAGAFTQEIEMVHSLPPFNHFTVSLSSPTPPKSVLMDGQASVQLTDATMKMDKFYGSAMVTVQLSTKLGADFSVTTDSKSKPTITTKLTLQEFEIGKVVNPEQVDISNLKSDAQGIVAGLIYNLNTYLNLPLPIVLPSSDVAEIINPSLHIEARELRFESDVKFPSDPETTTTTMVPVDEKYLCSHDQCTPDDSGVAWTLCDAICGAEFLTADMWASLPLSWKQRPMEVVA